MKYTFWEEEVKSWSDMPDRSWPCPLYTPETDRSLGVFSNRGTGTPIYRCPRSKTSKSSTALLHKLRPYCIPVSGSEVVRRNWNQKGVTSQYTCRLSTLLNLMVIFLILKHVTPTYAKLKNVVFVLYYYKLLCNCRPTNNGYFNLLSDLA